MLSVKKCARHIIKTEVFAVTYYSSEMSSIAKKLTKHKDCSFFFVWPRIRILLFTYIDQMIYSPSYLFS